jgi:hypothetical protein
VVGAGVTTGDGGGAAEASADGAVVGVAVGAADVPVSEAGLARTRFPIGAGCGWEA